MLETLELSPRLLLWTFQVTCWSDPAAHKQGYSTNTQANQVGLKDKGDTDLKKSTHAEKEAAHQQKNGCAESWYY